MAPKRRETDKERVARLNAGWAEVRQAAARRTAATQSSTGGPAGVVTGNPPPPPAPTVPSAGSQDSARSVVGGFLDPVGLGPLADWAWQRFLAIGGDSNPGAADQVYNEIRQNKDGTGLYKQRFSGMAALQEQGRAISETDYIRMEQQYTERMKLRGLPATFYDSPDDFGKLIANNVSVDEFDQRLAMAEEASMSSPKAQQVRDELTRLYGIPNAQGLMTAFFIDPEKSASIIKQQFQASTTAAASKRSGFGSLTLAEAERVGGLGFTEQQAAAGFGDLAGMGEFQQNLPGMGDDAVSRDDLIGDTFENNAQAKAKVEGTRRKRQAQFQGGGSYASTQRGVTGLGTSGG